MSVKGKLPILLGVCFLISGIFLIWQSMLYESTILMFISLAVTFWGSLLMFVSPKRSTKSVLLDATATSSLESLDKIIKSLDYNGKPVYLPPQSGKDSKSVRVFIPKDGKFVTLPVKSDEQDTVSRNPNGLYIIPPGLALLNLIENELGKNFTKVSLDYLVSHLPKALIEDLEIAKKCEISIEKDLMTAKLAGVTHDSLCRRLFETSTICSTIGCPFSSAIACAIAKSAGKPVVIEEANFSKKGKIVQITYKLLGA